MRKLVVIGMLLATRVVRGQQQADTSRVYFEFQVERYVTQAPDNPRPAYPAPLRMANVEGSVLVQFVVDTSGHAERSTFKVLKSSHDLFTNAVRQILDSLQFVPAELGGRHVRQLVQMPFNFSITPDVPRAPAPMVSAPVDVESVRSSMERRLLPPLFRDF